MHIVNIYIYMYVCMYIYVYICMCVCICVYVYVCMYVYMAYIHIQTYIHICVYVYGGPFTVFAPYNTFTQNWCVTCYNHVVTMIYGNYSAHQQPRCALDWHRLGQVLRKQIGRNDWLQIHMGPWCTWSWCSELRQVAYWMNIILMY